MNSSCTLVVVYRVQPTKRTIFLFIVPLVLNNNILPVVYLKKHEMMFLYYFNVVYEVVSTAIISHRHRRFFRSVGIPVGSYSRFSSELSLESLYISLIDPITW